MYLHTIIKDFVLNSEIIIKYNSLFFLYSCILRVQILYIMIYLYESTNTEKRY